MLEIIWTLLNFALIIFYIYLVIKATKLLYKHVGRFSGVMFIIILVTMTVKPLTSPPECPLIQNPDVSGVEEIKVSPLHALLLTFEGDTVTGEYRGHVKVISAGRIILLGAVDWEIKSVNINKTGLGYDYKILAIKEWKLLSVTVFSQVKEYEGKITEGKWTIKE